MKKYTKISKYNPKTGRNKAIIALWICGFGLREISRLLSTDYGNLKRFKARDMDKYLGEIMRSISAFMLKFTPEELKKVANDNNNSTK